MLAPNQKTRAPLNLSFTMNPRRARISLAAAMFLFNQRTPQTSSRSLNWSPGPCVPPANNRARRSSAVRVIIADYYAVLPLSPAELLAVSSPGPPLKHLYPISYHPRSRPSEPAAQQRRFCDLAISLLDQASQHNAPVPLSAESIIPNSETPDADDAATTPQASPSGVHPRKYALVQHLPTGDWWTSASSTPPATDAEEVDLKSLPTAKAELVATTSGRSLPGLRTISPHRPGE
ncbi:hypothetical protein NUW54_g14647 [Trametes sanguinea]|uniref:Uncharacterized protein n=1 Tax=Trametes sanguinea TaxID=158606 RepID=A0ACC1MB07_9APHY|nr:hypothetical protein NUW54_g14647 [Trametes sanguinea]